MASIRDPFDACTKNVVTHRDQPLEWANSQRVASIDALADIKQGDGPDLVIQGNMEPAVNHAIWPDGEGLAAARGRGALGIAYDWLEANLPDAGWAAGERFTLADCAAAPALFYADWIEPIGEARPRLTAYRARALAHPSVARAVEEARPYRHYFPLGARDRD